MNESESTTVLKLIDLSKSHGSISTVSYSHKYRVRKLRSSIYFVVVFGNLVRLQVHLR